MKLPTWMRVALYATAVMNVVGAATFLPPADGLRRLGGLPSDGHPLYMTTVAAFVFVFGVAYFVAAYTGAADRLFLGVAAAGKLSFFGLLVGYWLAGALPPAAPSAGAGDFAFGVMFAVWLYGTRRGARSA